MLPSGIQERFRFRPFLLRTVSFVSYLMHFKLKRALFIPSRTAYTPEKLKALHIQTRQPFTFIAGWEEKYLNV